MLIMDQSQFIALGERGEGDLRKITWFFKGNEGPVISNRVQGGGEGKGVGNYQNSTESCEGNR